MKAKNIPTWFWEQVVFAACLALAVYGQSRGAEREKIAGAIVAALAAFAAQKVRSGADRQREQDELHGVERARLKCAERVELWAYMAQALAVASMLTRGWYDVPALAFVVLYAYWRHIYRHFVPVKSDGGVSRDAFERALKREAKPGEELIKTLARLTIEARLWRDYAERAERRIEAEDGETTVFVRPQPAPVNADGPALWPIIAEELEDEGGEINMLLAKDARDRHAQGVAKYGVPLVANNGRDHLIDLYQEKLDAIVYSRAYHEQVDSNESEFLFDDALDAARNVREEILRRDGK